jgi:antibiotic biosynthesis monooxygenase (ABM) superfamily enzyme
MIERHVTFEVFLDKAAAFENFFVNDYRPAMSRMAGFVRADLLRESEAQQNYQMVIRFDSPESAAAWRASADHQALSPVLKAYYSSSHLLVYKVIA